MHVIWWPGNSSLKYLINYASGVYFHKYINTNYKIDQRSECASFIFRIQKTIRMTRHILMVYIVCWS